MKVALLSEWLDVWRGGAEASTQQFVHELIRAGVEVHLFTRSRPSPAPGLHVHNVSGAAMSRTRRSMTFAHRIERMVATDSFDVIHAISPCRVAHIYQPRGGTIAETVERNLAMLRTPAARFLKRYANRLNFKQRYLLRLERQLLGDREGPVIVAISDYVVRQLRRHYAVPEERIRMIYNGVDIDASDSTHRSRNRSDIRREFGVSKEDCLVLLVAHNFQLKGVARWLEALAVLVQRGARDIRSLVVGKGDSPRWHRTAERLGVAPFVTFTGPSDRVTAFRHAADALVHPTYYDPCSRVVLEAMADGLPCVVTRWDGAAEMIEDGRNGFILDEPADVAGLAERVHRLRDAAFRRRMGEAAANVADHVSMKRHTRELLQLYENLHREKARRFAAPSRLVTTEP